MRLVRVGPRSVVGHRTIDCAIEMRMSFTERFGWIVALSGLMLPGCGSSSHHSVGTQSHATRLAADTRATSSAVPPSRQLTGRRMHPRAGAVADGSVVNGSALWTDRVFATVSDGFALANEGSAQYPADTVDGGRVWRIGGPQVHVDAADGAEGVGYVGVAGARTFFAYGSSVVDVTANAGRTWWETFLGELVVAVVPGPPGSLVAYVQQQLNNNSINRAVTRQYVSPDGGHHWLYTAALGGLNG